ncbi:sel1 repeat family protein [Legionella anisa]|uniref:Sel1 repeat family protein n=1 Tax=Legionella anisa TaxID=28082 RepID=A0AAX0WTA9_9GAMM|nr:sel1 repeat family protein [Legionella anisa]AWN74503.1 sel1 repeat family protein [Legionella anisa]KTC70428.1 hypothetical protein Lani_1975 [Legionella anisa]MBN5935711.1 sel1 repeat family protein [Legionella anisa]MCW8425384.1 sel1 repeat family protein [Legionella anisa]MCW8449185.1 sel1 repeat family protein [Legionella anisa]
MGKVIIIGESHLDSIAELLTLYLMNHANVKISALGLELPENLSTIDEAIRDLGKTIQEYSAFIQQVNLEKDSVLFNEQLHTVEFMIQQVHQLQLKVEMLNELKKHKFHFYAIDKALQNIPGLDLHALMTDPERDKTMAAHIKDMAQNNEDISIVIVGQAHLERILSILKKDPSQDVCCVHCFSGMGYADRILTEILVQAPTMETSWKDEQGIYHLDCRNKSIEELGTELLQISETQKLSPSATRKKISSGEGTLDMESAQSLKSLLNILRHQPSYTFTPDFYNNYLVEDYYEAISRDNPSKITNKLNKFLEYLEVAHTPADPRLYHLYCLLALKQLDNTDDPLFKESLTHLERLLNQNKIPRLGEAWDKASALVQQMLEIISFCKKGEETSDSAIQKVNQLLDRYKEVIENYLDEGIPVEEAQILSKEMEKFSQLKQYIPILMQNLSKVNQFQLEMVQKALSPPEHSFGEDASRDSYHEAISHYCQAMIAVHQLSPQIPSNREYIIEHFTKAGELGFAKAYVELGHFYKKEGDFLKAFNHFLKAADQGSNVGCINITLLLAEHQHKAPLGYFMGSALHFLTVRSQKVNNNYTLDYPDLEFIDEKQQLFADQLSQRIKNSVFHTALDSKQEQNNFSLLSALRTTSPSNSFFRNPPDPVKLLNDFEVGLDYFLGQACQDLYRKENSEFLCKEYAAIAAIWFNILDKYDSPQERMIAVAMQLQEYTQNSPLNSSDPVIKFIHLAAEILNNAMLVERANLATVHIENIKSGKNIVHLPVLDEVLKNNDNPIIS